MKPTRKIGTKKRPGRPATGRGVQIGTRWAPDTIKKVDAWSDKQDDQPGRSEAMRRLVELGLKARK